jgi:phosphoglycerate dehydrogenase-like enzyme
MKELFVLQNLNSRHKEFLEDQLSDFYRISYPKNYSADYLKKEIKDKDVVFGSFILDDVLQEAENLKVLQLAGTGADKLNLELLKEKSIKVAKVQAHSQYVAEFAVSLMFGLLKKTSLFDRLLRSNSMESLKSSNSYDFSSQTIFGKTVGIIGYGNIGKKIAKFLEPYDIQTLVNTNTNKFDHSVSKDILIQNSDIIFVACPLTSKTYNLITLKDFKQAKSNSLWINISRGPIVNLEDLIVALNDKIIGGFSLDNWYPNRKDALDLLSQFDSVLLSPYRAIYLESGNPNITDAIENLLLYATKNELRNMLNYKKEY